MKRFHRQLNTIIGKSQTSVLSHFDENQNKEALNEYFTQVGPRMEKSIEQQAYQSIIEHATTVGVHKTGDSFGCGKKYFKSSQQEIRWDVQ